MATITRNQLSNLKEILVWRRNRLVCRPVAVETSVVETLEEGNKNSKKTKLDLIQERHKKTRKVSYLSNSADASLEYKNYLKIKLESKEKYYETKLELLRRSVEAKERQTTALQRISNSLEHLVDQRLLL
jgi:hypothetical protein